MATDRLPRPSWADLSTRAGLSAAQRRVLEAVESASEPQTTVQLARALNLHHNTVREHLDALASAGFVATSTRPTGHRGRSSLLYFSTAPDPAEVLNTYLTLLDAIADTLGKWLLHGAPACGAPQLPDFFNASSRMLMLLSRGSVHLWK